MTTKPLVIRIEEAKEELTNHLNAVLLEKELPCYLIEPIVAELHRQVTLSAQSEYALAKAQHEQAQTKEEGGTPDAKP